MAIGDTFYTGCGIEPPKRQGRAERVEMVKGDLKSGIAPRRVKNKSSDSWPNA